MATLLAGFWTAPFASADPVLLVTRGSVDVHEGDQTYLLIGTGFRLSGEIPMSGPLGACFPCASGTVLNLSASAAPQIFADPAVFDGRTYEGFTEYGGVFVTGRLSFDAGSVVVPGVLPGGWAERTAPFVFSGLLAAFDNFGLSGAPLFSANLRGRGTATVSFANHPDLGGIVATRLTYDFQEPAPIPEPATILLLGSGLGALGLRRGRRRVA